MQRVYEFLVFSNDGLLMFYHNFGAPVALEAIENSVRIQHLRSFCQFASERMAELAPRAEDQLTLVETSRYRLWYHELIDCFFVLIADPACDLRMDDRLKEFHARVFMPKIRRNFMVPAAGRITSAGFRKAVVDFFG
jgi:hypothetical protein